ncbi:MAG TPA: flavin reductase family protein [Longimicrobiales bacterium]|nr:flavin reductase family protein [Longimicrobiales bacterium]
MKLDGPEFRRVLGHFVTGVTVVTTRDRSDAPAGLTANAFASVSLDPPLVLVCIEKSSSTHALIAAAGVFAVNVLADGQERISRRFADETEGRFEGVAWRAEITGAPVLDDVLAWVDCRVHSACDGGDHTIYVGEVVAGDAREGVPLLFYRAGYGEFMP